MPLRRVQIRSPDVNSLRRRASCPSSLGHNRRLEIQWLARTGGSEELKPRDVRDPMTMPRFVRTHIATEWEIGYWGTTDIELGASEFDLGNPCLPKIGELISRYRTVAPITGP